jgi:hypothetical protein
LGGNGVPVDHLDSAECNGFSRRVGGYYKREPNKGGALHAVANASCGRSSFSPELLTLIYDRFGEIRPDQARCLMSALNVALWRLLRLCQVTGGADFFALCLPLAYPQRIGAGF